MPGIGIIYRAVTGETIPTPMRVLGAGILGGPLGILGAGLLGIVEAMFTLKPDLSRPSAPAGMTATGSESGVFPVSPGALEPGAYTTLATVAPEWMQPAQTLFASEPGRGAAAYQQASMEWRRAEALEKGLT